ncbi:MAG: alpha/beta hydrolase [Deltaproteobacteria bacterium]|jgi:arylformamidase|nr:alpha/beta hydrolase [Deltaproteobacteria bacterium]MBT4644858.1 alpha/beta hydrolase [Deltaproteobacteria bacterium]MBT6499513.1 alpha/beta hydrolase [Deltaproteobacteria bacterium]MBT7156054.1 alpha/beta hydrolase [Deltaproteobacteria bacterium]MBT7713745.1 alpha/beta hydrolase [Deltaproteobacteria bacterium]
MTEKLTKAQVKDLNCQYLPLLTVKNGDEYLSNSAERSARIRRKLDCQLDLPYGDSSGQMLDVFPGRFKDTPVHVFIHGGYWRAAHINKSVYSHIAEPLVAAGATVVLLDYDLCPQIRISDIVEQIKTAMVWIYKNIQKYNGDRKHIFVSGHSAGGHLAAMMMATDWWQERGLPRDLIKGTVLLSGLFDIEPHRHTDLQMDIRLTAREAKAMSPMHLKPISRGPCIVAVGKNEPDLFHWQSLQYSAQLRLNRIKAEYMSMPGDNHFSITDRLGNEGDPLTKELLAQMTT